MALASGLIQAAVHVIQVLLPGERVAPADTLPHIFWILPAFNLLLFLVVGVLLLLPLYLLRRWVRPDRVAYAAFGALGAFGVVLAIQERYLWILYPWAIAVFCLGVAVFLFRAYGQRPPPTATSLRRDFLRVAGLVALANVVGYVVGREPLGTLRGSRGGEQAGFAGVLAPQFSRRTLLLGSAPAIPQTPNVLLIVLDTLRADHMSAYGYGRPTTPNLDRLAQQGTLFENAYSASSWTLPSHATLFTGRPVHEHGAVHVTLPLGAEFPTLAEHFAAHGYETAGFVANVRQAFWGSGIGRGFQVYEDYYWSLRDIAGHTPYVSGLNETVRKRLKYREDLFTFKLAETVRLQFLNWIDVNPRGRFFAFLNFFDVHEPYIAPPEFSRKFSGTPPGYLPPDDQKLATERINRYDNCLAYMDHELGVVFDRLAALGVLDDTVVIVTSDHGEGFGNHDLFYHGNSLYRDLVHVPLIVRYPRAVAAGGRVPCAVGSQALAASTVSLAGIQQGSPFLGTPMDGPWMALHGDPACDDGVAFSELLMKPSGRKEVAKQKSVATRDWHLIVDENGKLELYRLDRDPNETENLASTAEGADPLRTLADHLRQRLTSEDWAIYGRPFTT